MPDSKAKYCINPNCCKEFGFFQKRHPCCICCLVYCKNCTLKTTIQDLKLAPERRDGKHGDHKNLHNQSTRICLRCNEQIKILNNHRQNQREQVKVNAHK